MTYSLKTGTGIAATTAAILMGTFGSVSTGQNIEAAYGGDASAEMQDSHQKFFLAGIGFTYWDTGNWSHAYSVKALGKGRGRGTVRVEYVEELGGPIDIEYTSKVDCVEFDRRTGEMWIGGTIIDTNIPDLLNVYVVDYALDGGPGGTDLHGDFLVDPGSGVTCVDRPAPYVPDPVMRGNIYVFKNLWNGPPDD